MRAMTVTDAGPSGVLELAEVPTPAPGPGRVRVRVRAAGVQPADVAVLRGRMPPGMTRPRPLVPGNELAGVIDAVGSGVTAWADGDEVIVFTTLGAHAEQAVVPADQVVPRPAGMPWEEAGALSASGQTAHTALEDLGVGPGDTLVVHAAAGGVGTMAVQLAVARGARVIGTARPENHAHLRALGAEPVEYGDGLVERLRELAPGGADAALDAIGGGALAASLAVVSDRRRIGTVADHAAAARLGLRAIRTRRSAARLGELARLAADGTLRVVVGARVPLHEAPRALDLVAGGHVRGKVVLTVGEEPVDVLARRVGAWTGVTIGEGRFGATAFHLGRREIGHVHPGPRGGVADLPFPRSERDALVAAGRARPHRFQPDSGWVSAPLRDRSELEGAIALFAMSYERARRAREIRGGAPADAGSQ